MNQAELLAKIALLESQIAALPKGKERKPRSPKPVGKGASAKPKSPKAPKAPKAEKGELSFDSVGWNFVVEVETEEKDDAGNLVVKVRSHKQGTRVGDAQNFAFRALRKNPNARAFLCAYFVPHTMRCTGWDSQGAVMIMDIGTPELRKRSEVARIEADNFSAIEQESRINKGLEKPFTQTAKLPSFAANVDVQAMAAPLTIDPEIESDKSVLPYNPEEEKSRRPWMRKHTEYRAWDKARKGQGLKLQKS